MSPLVYLAYFSSFSSLFPLFFLLKKRRQIFTEFRPMALLRICTIIVEVINLALTRNRINNLLVINLFTIIEFTLISLFYKTFFSSFLNTRLFSLIILGFTLVALAEIFSGDHFNTPISTTESIESLLCIGYASFSFFLIIKHLVYENLLETPFFWINTGVLIYFSGNFFLFLFDSYLQKYDVKDYGSLYTIHSVLNILYYILISTGFWKVQKI